MTNYCEKCQSEMTYKEGVSRKNNKPWKAWFCPNKCEGSTIWVDTPKQAVHAPKVTQQDASVLNGLRELYLLQKAAYLALMSRQAVPPEEALKWLEENIIMLKETK